MPAAIGACYHGDPLPAGNNPHYWVVLGSAEKHLVMVSLTTPQTPPRPFAHRVTQADFPCLHHDSDVFWRGLNVFATETLAKMRPCGTAAHGAVRKLINEGRRRKLIPADMDAML